MVLTSVRILRKDAEKIASNFRKDFKFRSIGRRVVVKPVGRVTLKKLLTKQAFKKEKKMKRFGVFIFNK